MPRKLLVGGVQRNGTLKSKSSIKKVPPPTVPDLPFAALKKNPCVCNGDLDQVTADLDESDFVVDSCYSNRNSQSSVGFGFSSTSVYHSESFSMKKMTPGTRGGSNGQVHLTHVIVHNYPDSLPSTPVESSPTPSLSKGRGISGTQASLEDQGIDVSSPGRHSPGGSSGGSSVSRHSLSSLDSGRASAPGSDGKVINRRLSVHSYESGSSPHRRSYHSSNSSLASGGGGGSDDATGTPGPNVAEMVLHGLPDIEVLSNWLTSLHFEEYISLFLQAGYDMPTITRMTPEDLTAIGITKPNHRRKLKAEIAKLNISDKIPEYKPNSLLEWLQLLRLEEYYETLCQQKYDTIDRVTELTWEDLEDIGIQKLGHQKKILLAIKRIEDINQGRRPNLYPHVAAPHHPGVQPCGPAIYPRPSTLGTIQPCHYPAQEVAIATHRPKNSPSTDSVPEMKTFQQSPVKEEVIPTQVPQTSSQEFSSSTVCYQNGNTNLVLSPSRGRSLESLHTDNSTPPILPTKHPEVPVLTHVPAQPLVSEQTTKVSSKDWKTTDLDGEYSSECEGTATLNRPKGMVRLRPMAKITAKTREEIAEAIMDIPDKEFRSLISQTKPLDGWSSLDGSPRHGTSTTMRASTLRRPPPPPPPKRSNSTKGERPGQDSSKVDTAESSSTVTSKVQSQVVKEVTEDFPPPPSPLASAVEADKSKPAPASEPMDELFCNPLFKQRRKDSAESSSSVDSTALPFANEAIGTIKQKSFRQNPALQVDSKYGKNSASAKKSSSGGASHVEHEYDTTPDAVSPGDVIDDIENMLANLSDQLDAMLDEEQVQK